jgi:hypothetical protein
VVRRVCETADRVVVRRVRGVVERVVVRRLREVVDFAAAPRLREVVDFAAVRRVREVVAFAAGRRVRAFVDEAARRVREVVDPEPDRRVRVDADREVERARERAVRLRLEALVVRFFVVRLVVVLDPARVVVFFLRVPARFFAAISWLLARWVRTMAPISTYRLASRSTSREAPMKTALAEEAARHPAPSREARCDVR